MGRYKVLVFRRRLNGIKCEIEFRSEKGSYLGTIKDIIKIVDEKSIDTNSTNDEIEIGQNISFSEDVKAYLDTISDEKECKIQAQCTVNKDHEEWRVTEIGTYEIFPL